MTDLDQGNMNDVPEDRAGAPGATDDAVIRADVVVKDAAVEVVAADTSADAESRDCAATETNFDTRVIPASAMKLDADGFESAANDGVDAILKGRRPAVVGAFCVALALVVVACVFAFGSPSPVVKDESAAQGSLQSQQFELAENAGEEVGDDEESAGEPSEVLADDQSSSDSLSEDYADGGDGLAGVSDNRSSDGGVVAGATVDRTNGIAASSGASGGSSSAASSEPAPAPAPVTIAVSVYIDSSKAASAGYPSCMASTSVTLSESATVYDALCASGVAVGGSSSYVTSINGLAEKQISAGSGWMYSVNGVTPMVPAGAYELSPGDSVRWYYVV